MTRKIKDKKGNIKALVYQILNILNKSSENDTVNRKHQCLIFH